MGAFLLVSSKAAGFDSSKAIETISSQCLTNPLQFNLPGWKLYLFQKALCSEPNYVQAEGYSVFATGTPFLEGFDYRSTLKEKLDQISNGVSSHDDLRGLYCIFLGERERLKFVTDRYGLYSIYHTSEGDVLSSSFLGLCQGIERLTPAHDAMVENMLTGSLTGIDTLFSEIKRFDPAVPFSFRGIEYIPCRQVEPKATVYLNKTESLNAQAEVLDRWFSGLKPFALKSGVDSGITGGLDSRLILALCRRHFPHDRIQFHSHLRKNRDIDFRCGYEICKKTGLEFIETPVRDMSDYGESEIVRIMDCGMLFTDGQVRTHSFWQEEFNTAAYRINILKDKRLGLNGIGGEQYRNMERYLFPSRPLRPWIRFELIERFCGRSSAGIKTIDDLTERLNEKIERRIGITGGKKINLLFIKRYMNEIYNPSNRGLRACHENRLSYFLSPFADPEIAGHAYSLVDHLGVSISYEAELINLIDPEAASFTSSYGFRFNRREPVTSIVPGLVFSNFLPSVVQSVLYSSVSIGTKRWVAMQMSNQYLRECTEAVRSYSLPVNLDEIIKSKDLGPLVFSMGHLLKRLSHKLKK